MSVTFTSTVQNGGSNTSYQWYKNGSAISGATASTYSTSSLSNSDAIYVSYKSTCADGNIINSGLVLNLDASNNSSYPGSGTTWYDLSGNGNHVTMQNSGNIDWNAGGYFTLTSSGYFSKATTTNLPLANSPYNLSVWVKLPSNWGNQGFISIGNEGYNYQLNGFRTNGTNGYNHSWWGSDLAPNNGNLSPTTSWFNAVAQFNGTTRSIWINGVQLTSDSPGSIHNVTSSLLKIGLTTGSEYLNGDIGQALIYNRALSSAEIIQNYNIGASRFGLSAIGTTTISSNTITTTISANNTITLTSSAGTNAQTVCNNSAITNITYATTGVTGATFSGLPTGVTGTWSVNIVTISGTPSVAGTYSYTVTSTGGCGNLTASGTIIVIGNPGLNNFNAVTRTYFDGSYTITAPSTGSDGAISYTSSNTAVATISGTTVTIVSAGTSTITATQAATSNYCGESIQALLTVNSVQVVTKNGKTTSTSTNFVSKNGSLNTNQGLNSSGQIKNTRTPAID